VLLASAVAPPATASSAASVHVAAGGTLGDRSGFGSSASLERAGCSGVDVKPGRRLQAVIDRHPPGTTFCMASGTYRIAAPIDPKDGDKFVAVRRRRAILTGNNTTSMAFNGQGVYGVVVKGLVITHFVPPAQGGMAALKAAGGWRIINNEISYNANTGLFHEGDSLIRGNYIHHNSKIGLGGYKASNSIIENNKIAFNGFAGGPNNGGSKWVGTTNITIRNNYFHDNDNNEIWFDTGNTGVLIDGNTVVKSNTYGKAISMETNAGTAVIRNNTITVGSAASVAIMVSNSSNEQIYNNTISSASSITQRWGVINLFYDSSRTGYDTANNAVFDNTIILRGVTKYAASVSCYLVTDCSPYWTTKGNSFQGDTYIVPSLTGQNWVPGSPVAWTQWRALGFDTNGTVKVR
jgi:hypothetical protein